MRRRKNKPYFALTFIFVCSLFIVITLHDYLHGVQKLDKFRGVQKLDKFHGADHHQRRESSTNSSQLNVSAKSNDLHDVLDRFTSCSSTIRYKRKEVFDIERRNLNEHEDVKAVECDLFSGRWIFDNGSRPLYKEADCPYMSDQLACQKYGRLDLDYQYWRWQPNGCDLKRWNATQMWDKLKGKRLMFVGDSLNRGQWISMVCLLQAVIPENRRSMSPNAHLTVFRAEDYNASVEFLWAPLLVESNSDDPVNHRLQERIIRPDSAHRHVSHWQNADILVFNTYLWWRQGPIKILWSDEHLRMCEEMEGRDAMRLALEFWAKWVSYNVDPVKTRVFFVTMSPTHFWRGEWRPGEEGNCYDEKLPIENPLYWGRDSDQNTMRIFDEMIGSLQEWKVAVLNVTQLSEYRKDGHPSVFRKFWEDPAAGRTSRPESYSDCIHWCLPGVPDVWNELFFHLL